jgi:hypothetical protein
MARESSPRARIVQAARLLGVALPVVLIVLAILILPVYVPLVTRVIHRRVTEGCMRSRLEAYVGGLILAVRERWASRKENWAVAPSSEGATARGVGSWRAEMPYVMKSISW